MILGPCIRTTNEITIMSENSKHASINSKILESRFPELTEENGGNRFLRGNEANLSSLRLYQNELKDENDYTDFRSNSNSITSKTEDEKRDEGEQVLCYVNSVSVTVKNAPAEYEGAIGHLIISTKRVFFIAGNGKDTEKDFQIDAQRVSLHAMMSEPDYSVYCQLADDKEEDEEYTGPSEIFFYPQIISKKEKGEGVDDIDEKKRNLNQLIFDCFTELINLNPIMYDDQNDGGAAGGLMSMLGMLSGNCQFGEDDEMICRVDPNKFVVEDEEVHEENDDSPSNYARNQMLERLDNLLVVPPEYEVEGQFDDADEEEVTAGDEDINNIL